METEKTRFFGDVDRGNKGTVTSEFPAWYFETHLDNLKEERNSLIRRMERGEIPPDNVPYHKAEAEAMREKIEEIESSQPTMSDQERMKLQKYHKELSGKISESLYTRSEQMMGTANAHEEARRMVQPCVSLSPPLRSMAKECNVRISKDFKVSRNGAIKIWKIIGKLIGEGTNVEGLRRDKATVLTNA